MGSLAGTLTAEPATSAEGVLAEMLADVMKIEQVPFDCHFFDDLGADSMVMAKFCARVRKRDGLPVMSMQDIYAHPSIRGLAQAFGIAEAEAEVNLDAIATLIQPRDPILARSAAPAPASTRQYLLCGALQLLFFLGYAWAAAFVGARAYEWVSAAKGYEEIYLRSVVFGGAAFIVLCTLPILAKWVLIGRWKPRQIRVWSLGYFRFWIVKTLVKSNPLVLVAVGSPLYTWYLRALGAKIGRGTVIFTRHVPACTDLLTIGPDTVIRKDSFLNCYRAYGGWIQTGRVTIGRNVFIGEKTVLDINTSMGDVSQLGHTSALHSGQRVRTGERWHGSPAQRTDVNYLRVSAKPCGRWRRFRFSAVTLLWVFFVSLPLLEGGAFALLTAVPKLGAVLKPSDTAITTLALYRDALVISLVLFFGAVLLGLVFVATVPRLLNVFIKPSAVYPLFGFRDRAHRAIVRITGGKFFTRLFGDSSSIVHYLRWLGYDLGEVVQTGSNFGTDVGQENPYMCIIGSGTMVADGLVIVNSDVSATSFRVSPVYIGGDSFFGNNIYYPAGGRVGNNCLIATKAMIPLDGKVREGRPARLAVVRDPADGRPRPGGRTGRGRAAAAAARQELAQPADDRHLLVRAAAARAPGHRLRAGRLRLVRRVAQLEMAFLFAVSVMITPVYCARGAPGPGFPPPATAVLLHLRPVFLAARAPVEGAGRAIRANVRRHAVQERGLARARRHGGQAGLRRRLPLHRAQPDHRRRRRDAERRRRDPVPLPGGWRVQVRPDHDRLRLHHRGRRDRPLRRDDGRRLGAGLRFIPDEGRGDPAARAVGGNPAREM